MNTVDTVDTSFKGVSLIRVRVVIIPECNTCTKNVFPGGSPENGTLVSTYQHGGKGGVGG